MITNKWEKISEKVEKIGYKTVHHKSFKMPDGLVGEFTTWGKEGAHNAGVIAVTKNLQVVIARQFRPGPEIMMDEIPGGGVENGEDLQDAALRELREETGYITNGKITYLGSALREAYSNETSHYFLALDCELSHGQELDDSEHVEVVLISVDELLYNAKNAKMTDAVAVLMAYDELKEVTHE